MQRAAMQVHFHFDSLFAGDEGNRFDSYIHIGCNTWAIAQVLGMSIFRFMHPHRMYRATVVNRRKQPNFPFIPLAQGRTKMGF
jgi:hypothetical protein